MNPRIHRYEIVSSTNDAARRLADDGVDHGTVAVAREQTAGRGRRGRTWDSPWDAGLYVSFIVRPFDVRESGALALRCALATAMAIERFGSAGLVRIKWPNDPLINNRKVSGILVEAASGFAIVGIGINLAGERNEFVLSNRDRVTALDLEGVRVEPDVLLDALTEEFDRLVPQSKTLVLTADVLDEWARRDVLDGRRIVWTANEGDMEGVAVGPASDGRLRVRRDNGEIVMIAAGEVSVQGAE